MNQEQIGVSAAAAELASSYMPFARYSEKLIRDFILAATSRLRSLTPVAIDVGAGTGTPARILRDLGYRVVAVDVSTAMLAKLASDNPVLLARIAANANALPLTGRFADLALFVESLHLLKDPEIALDEAIRVTRPGGCILIVDTLREDLRIQVFHKYFPAFFDLDSQRHFSLSELLSMALGRPLRLIYLDTQEFELTFPTAAAMTKFVSSRPFFGLRQLPEDVFVQQLESFAHAVAREFPVGPAISAGRETCVILEVTS
ncbi:class I SAM-dependent methyltransferase [Micromonospora purpureochromogenes]|uniref:SAM-dependent methyltransferase n=1 Tax=Micromonospora purpureochromogenes TaxID=47872 RepID=A0ABX2RSH1_9ACTN|nr:class I SAM-dependent methyltransferase [Micromonospora purpureochromogenes]NYF58988.1 SAM-dependent methyltransferase [Micromonospora purpureochromogenes]